MLEVRLIKDIPRINLRFQLGRWSFSEFFDVCELKENILGAFKNQAVKITYLAHVDSKVSLFSNEFRLFPNLQFDIKECL